jgi:hypothetical protein
MNKVLSLTSLALLGACAGTQPESSIIPPRFEPGAGESMTLIVPAKGVQIYECRANQAGAYEWTFVAPDAQLFDTTGKPIGRHYAGPSWESGDGSKIVGAVQADQGVEFLVVTRWTSLPAIREFAGKDAEAAVVAPQVPAMMIEYDRTVRHYEILELK